MPKTLKIRPSTPGLWLKKKNKLANEKLARKEKLKALQEKINKK